MIYSQALSTEQHYYTKNGGKTKQNKWSSTNSLTSGPFQLGRAHLKAHTISLLVTEAHILVTIQAHSKVT